MTLFDIVYYIQDDGEAGIALVGVHSEYPKFNDEMNKDEKAGENSG